MIALYLIVVPAMILVLIGIVLVPVVLLIVEVVLLIPALALGLVLASLARRPWVLEASRPVAGTRRHAVRWGIKGWRASSRLARHMARQIEQTGMLTKHVPRKARPTEGGRNGGQT